MEWSKFGVLTRWWLGVRIRVGIVILLSGPSRNKGTKITQRLSTRILQRVVCCVWGRGVIMYAMH